MVEHKKRRDRDEPRGASLSDTSVVLPVQAKTTRCQRKLRERQHEGTPSIVSLSLPSTLRYSRC
jgi:hypothetical protein